MNKREKARHDRRFRLMLDAMLLRHRLQRYPDLRPAALAFRKAETELLTALVVDQRRRRKKKP